LEELAKEELRHKEKLLGIIKDKRRLTEFGAKKIQDLRIVDEMEDTTLSQDANYQQILVYAAKREKSDCEYYGSMATGLEGTEFGDLFSKLAQEELKHKNRIEKEYDEYLMKEN
jgi:rubrerythrin